MRFEMNHYSSTIDSLDYGLRFRSTSNSLSSFYAETTTLNQYHYRVNYNGTDKFSVQSNGHIWAQAITTLSDKTLKSDFKRIEDPVSIIQELRGMSYFMKDGLLDNEGNPIRQIGVIAQEVEEVFPEAVSQAPSGKKGVNYNSLVALLIEGFNAQSKEIQKQSETIERLKESISNCCNFSRSNFRIKNISDSIQNIGRISSSIKLYQNRPNPFSKSTTIKFFIPNEVKEAQLYIFDMQGSHLRTYAINERLESSIFISEGEYKAGMYIYSLIADGQEVATKRMILTD